MRVFYSRRTMERSELARLTQIDYTREMAFIAVAPEFQGTGLGSRLLKATLEQVDAAGLPAYVENSRARNTPFYARAGFVPQRNISPPGAPPQLAMWREPRPV